jgi:hypothetical protein
MSTATSYVPRLKQRYNDEVRDRLLTELGLSNVMQVPRLEKIVVNMGVGDAVGDAKALDAAMRDLATITGQKRVRLPSTTFVPVRVGVPHLGHTGMTLDTWMGASSWTRPPSVPLRVWRWRRCLVMRLTPSTITLSRAG